MLTDLRAEAAALLAAYCRGVDDRDPDLLRTLVTDDVVLYAADGSVSTGADAFVALFARYWAANPVPGLHLVSNVEVRPDGEVLALFHAVSMTDDGRVASTWGRYRNTVRRTPAGDLRLATKRILPWGRATT